MNARDPVAVIGLGAMGFPIARCLLAAGFPLTVYNRTTSRADALVAAGAALAGSPAEAAARARVVISMVSDERAVDAVVNGPRCRRSRRSAVGSRASETTRRARAS